MKVYLLKAESSGAAGYLQHHQDSIHLRTTRSHSAGADASRPRDIACLSSLEEVRLEMSPGNLVSRSRFAWSALMDAEGDLIFRVGPDLKTGGRELITIFVFCWHAVNVHVQPEPIAGHEVVIVFFGNCVHGGPWTYLSPQSKLALAHLWFFLRREIFVS